MEPTYYTPKAQEFYHGFEYERKDSNDKWHPKKFDLENDWQDIAVEMYASVSHYIRVKHLDRTDIEGEGWRNKVDDIFTIGVTDLDPEIESPFYLLAKTKMGKDNEYIIWNMFEGGYIKDAIDKSKVIFYGTILNKSELKFQMARLGIKTEKV